MSNLRPILTVAAFVVCLGVTIATAIQVAVQGIPHEPPVVSAPRKPSQLSLVPMDERELRETLLSQEIDQRSESDQRRLARNLEYWATLRRDAPFLPDDLNRRERERLRTNLIQLGRVLLFSKVDHYFALDESRQADYLDALLDRWLPLVQRVKAKRGPREAAWLGLVDPRRAMQQIEQLREQIEPEQLDRVMQFVAALEQRRRARQQRD